MYMAMGPSPIKASHLTLSRSPAHSVFLQSTSSHSSYHSLQIWITTILIFLSGGKTLAMLSRKLWLR